jgi:hypothetical protein
VRGFPTEHVPPARLPIRDGSILLVTLTSTRGSYKYITSRLFAHTVRLKTDTFSLLVSSAVFVVQMSDLFEKLRPRVYKKSAAQGNGPEGGPGAQNFVRTTRKYWVSTEDVSTVKQALAEHLPVFLMERQKPSSSGGGDGGSPTAGFGPGVAADSQVRVARFPNPPHTVSRPITGDCLRRPRSPKH